VRSYCEKDYCLVRQSFTETIFALRHGAALLADDEHQAEVAVNARTATATQIGLSWLVTETLRVVIGVFEDTLDPSENTAP